MESININIRLQQDPTPDLIDTDTLVQNLLTAAKPYDKWSDSTGDRAHIMKEIRELIPDRKKTEIIRSMANIKFKALKHIPTPPSEFTRVYTASEREYNSTGSLKDVREFLSRSFYESKYPRIKLFSIKSGRTRKNNSTGKRAFI